MLFANMLNTGAPELFIYTNHAVKHKKIKLISQFVLNNHKNKTKRSKPKQYLMTHSEVGFQGFCPLSRLYDLIVLQDFLN